MALNTKTLEEIGKVGGLSEPAAAVLSTLVTSGLSEETFTVALDAAYDALPLAASAIHPAAGLAVGVLQEIAGSIGWASGNGACSNEPGERGAWCRALYSLPVGTGPGGQVVPADWFAKGRGGLGETYQATLGEVLQWVTLTDSVELIKQLRQLPPGAVKLGEATGLDAKRVAQYKGVIDGIKALHKKGDGGRALSILLLGMLQGDFDAKRLTPELVETILKAKSWPICESVRDAGEFTCYDHDKRPFTAFMDLVNGWRQTVNPYYQASPRAAAEVKKRKTVPATGWKAGRGLLGTVALLGRRDR